MPECRHESDGESQPRNPCPLDAVIPHGHFWEHQFGGYELKPQWGDNPEDVAVRKANWNKALELVGDSVVLATKEGPVQTLARKGYEPLAVPEAVVRAAEEYDCATPSKSCRPTNLMAASPSILRLMPWPPSIGPGSRSSRPEWTTARLSPPIRCFRKVMDGGAVVRGFLRDGVVYINEDLANGASVELRQTVLEELAHYLTGSKDETRDLQDWAFKLAVRVAMAVEAGVVDLA